MSCAETKSEEQGHEIAQNTSISVCPFKQIHTTIPLDDQKNIQTNEQQSTTNIYAKNLTSNSVGRHKRKNFYPRPMTLDATMNATSSHKNPISHVIPTSTTDVREPLDLNAMSQLTQCHPWLQLFNQYEKIIKAADLKAYQSQQTSTIKNGHYYPSNSKWVSKLCHSELAATTIHEIKNEEKWDKLLYQDETEPPTLPTTPPQKTFYSNSRCVSANINIYTTEMLQNSISTRMQQTDVEYTQCPDDQIWSKVIHQSKTKDWEMNQNYTDYRFLSTQSLNADSSNYEHCKVKSPIENEKQSNFQNIDELSKNLEKREKIKYECDEIETTVDDGDDIVENNIYDDGDYQTCSPNNYTASRNTDRKDNYDENDDSDHEYSLNVFGNEGHSESDDQQLQQIDINYDNIESDRTTFTVLTDVSNPDSSYAPDDINLQSMEKESTCSHNSSRISPRNVDEFHDQDQVNMSPSALHYGIGEKIMHTDFLQKNMNKFNSHFECSNEMCRLENLREHYHCYDYPCFGKILLKKEEVIRHVKWHHKRIESLNHGFMRFSSSDDCTSTFGLHCQHNLKQTHYHCFQPNCERVYISTSDVQMHSNFHRKDSAIHKEGFQRYRANEKCRAGYCTFANQKTTHFHCRRDNCHYTFKNKADMEKHKTYHIKEIKLARDGFKKFLKNEACPYKRCKFSKVCNHIHCARENCFYVLHSSGQLTSHKRKHERIDKEQTYCRFKMFAVKAALMGNVNVASATPSKHSFDDGEMAALNYSKPLSNLKDLKCDSVSPKLSLESPKQKHNFEEREDESSNKSSLISIEFLEQMKRRHEEIQNQKTHQQTKTSIISTESPTSSATDRTKSPTHLQTQSNNLTSSIIDQFFTSECPAQLTPLKNDQLLYMKCSWNDKSLQHFHCKLKGCEAVVPNNILNISAHIRMHGYNSDVYATAIGASPNATLISSNPMQITTIDGFFNRKRGRPPKNRFVEVYKNSQQSPQAIFTSFKLDKQTRSKESLDPGIASSGHQPCPDVYTSLMDKQQQEKQQKEETAVNPDLQFPSHPTISSEFVIYNQNENCSVADEICSLAMQQHYHCASAENCNFATVELDVLRTHFERQHTSQSFTDAISKKFKRFDRNIGLDCGISDCRLRKSRLHFHCRQCCRQISPFDLKSHTCEIKPHKQRSTLPKAYLKKISSPSTEFLSNKHKSPVPVEDKHLSKDDSLYPSVTFSTLNELRRKVSGMEPESISSRSKPSHEDEKVIVVRASGTYFPENTTEFNKGPSPVQQKHLEIPKSQQSTPIVNASNTAYYSMPYCKKSCRTRDHCDQECLDVKWRAHQLKHLQATNQPIPFHLSNNLEPQELKSTSRQKKTSLSYDEQPQDLSLFPVKATNIHGTTLDEEEQNQRESFSPPSSANLMPEVMPGRLLNYVPQDIASNVSLHLATLYKQNPYFYQHLYPFLTNSMNRSLHQATNQTEANSNRITGNEDTCILSAPGENLKQLMALNTAPALHPRSSEHYSFLNPLLMIPTPKMENFQPKPEQITLSNSIEKLIPSSFDPKSNKPHKRKLTNDKKEFSTVIDALLTSTKKQFAAGLSASPVVSNNSSYQPGVLPMSRSTNDQHVQHCKIREEQIPHGYLKFRFNEDCFFPKCGYRNHQSHFHCDRNDCHYSFCDKTRFVQHTARHERLDKLMGNDFRQYRANMSCGYENCSYFKNLGSTNKSSHFHCLKCDFICSDTNKVVAHRRQHNKLEYIRMAGFRKVTNSEKCDSNFETTVLTNSNEINPNVECSYSQKQTHYHCLVCDVSVLSKAQLSSHKHKT